MPFVHPLAELQEQRNPLVIQKILDKHAEEASFLWILRQRVVHLAGYFWSDLVRLDQRIQANLDGLRLAGKAGMEIARQEWNHWQEPGEAFVATILALQNEETDIVEEIIEMAGKSLFLTKAIVSAFAWLPYDCVQAHISNLFQRQSSQARYIAFSALLAHRKKVEPILDKVLQSEETLLRAQALRAIAQLGCLNYHEYLRQNYCSPDEQCRFYSAWSGAILGDQEAIEHLKAFLHNENPWKEKALRTLLGCLDFSRARSFWKEQLCNLSLRLAIVGAGILGDVQSIPWLLRNMEIPSVSRISGQMFQLITGIGIDNPRLSKQKPEGFSKDPTENPEDPNVQLDPDEFLPWPDSRAIQEIWNAHRQNFQDGTRYFLGNPMSMEWAVCILKKGDQWQREQAAMELARMQPGYGIFETRANAALQKQKWENIGNPFDNPRRNDMLTKKR